MSFDVGDQIRLTGTFTDADGVATAPSGTVYIKVLTPGSATATSYSGTQLTNSSTGVYYVDVCANASGRWHWRCEANGSGCYGAEETYFDVDLSRF